MITYAQKLRSLRRAPTVRPVTAPTPVVGDAAIEHRVLGLLATTLGVEASGLSARTPFVELGLSSLLGVRFLDAVNRAFGLRLGVEVLFAHGSVTDLARHVATFAPAQPAAAPMAPAAPAPVASVAAIASTPEHAAGDIAVIGMAGRFPGAADLDSFWQALAQGRCLVSEVPSDRWNAASFYDPDPSRPDRTVSKWAGFLDGIDQFDAGFFNISPREAAAMDPQHRLFLEQAWLAFENAGYPQDRLKGSATGVFVGASNSGYDALLEPGAKAAQSYGLTGNLVSLLASRISYFLDLRGPALVVDTACSASLVALDLACQALRRGEIDLALVGGVTLFLDEKPFIAMTRTGMLSPDGRCHTFDADANGIAVGEAVAAVVLKPMARALADGDRIDAVIKATGTNQDGRSNGITAPNPDAQAALLRAVHERAGIDPSTLTYIEAHGTGTPLGDPIEIAALRSALGERSPPDVPCGVGSVKSNIGHTAEAAGLAGLIKTVLCLRHGELVPSVNFSALNPKIDVGGSGLSVVTARQPWRAPAGAPRRAGVSAFGLSGTNAHAVLEEAPAAPMGARQAGPHLLLVSARDADALRQRAADLAAWLQGPGARIDLGDIAATLVLGRTHFDHRMAVVARSHHDAIAALAGSEAQSAVVRQRTATGGQTDDLDALAARYLAGETPDWPWLFPAGRRAVPLPPYPFTRGTHWAARRPAAASPVHPFADPGTEVVHRFTPADPVVRDHVIGGVPLLHASIFLEMARLAGQRAAGRDVTGLRDVAWSRTVSVPEAGVTVRMAVDGARVTMLDGTGAAPIAHCAVTHDRPEAPARLDVAAIKAAAEVHVSQQDLDAMDRGVVRLGPSFAGFDEAWIGADQALAWVGPVTDRDGCDLPPRLMDAAIQTGAMLLARGDGPVPRLRYPSRAAAIDVAGSAPLDGCFILARQTGPDRVDLTIADPQGRPAIHWTGFEMLGPAARTQVPAQSGGSAVAPRTFRALWVERPADQGKAREPDTVIGVGPLAAMVANGAPVGTPEQARGDRIVFCDSGAGDATALLRLVRGLASGGRGKDPIELRVVTTTVHRVTGHESGLRPDGATVQGLAKAIGREFPAWRVVPIDIDPAEWSPALRTAILRAAPTATGEPVALRGGTRFERVLEPVEAAAAAPVLREGGAYLVVGGMGRVGRDLCRALAGQWRARLLLVGRQPLDRDRSAFLETLRALGATAEYLAADITTPDGAAAAVAALRDRHGAVDGVIQAVFDPLFAPLERTEEAAFATAVRPKVDGLRQLAAATAGQALDFLAVFSSIGAFSAFPANVGQASYCAACSFEEAFAASLRDQGRNVRLIQWGLWENEAFAGEGLQRLRRQGVHPMVVSDAVEAFARALGGADWHVVHASLNPEVWRAMGAGPAAGQAHAEAAAALCRPNPDVAAADATLHLAVDAHARSLTATVLRDRGWDIRTPEALRSRVAVLPRHGRLFDAVLDLLRRGGDGAVSRDALLARAPSLRDPLALLDLCVAALPDVLTGEREGTDVMFPGGSMRLVEAIYRDQPVLAACNTLLAEAVAAARPTRVLEVGAGTGATADAVLARIGQGVEYHYTDVSAGFVRHARARYADPRLRFAVLDIEKDPLAQGFEPAGFDVVVATNVLHATRDIRQTLDHIASVLRPGGLLLINEMTVAEDFATLTFGLLDGWWRPVDPARRLAHSPLLDVPGWRRALVEAGFGHVTAAPAPGFADAGTSPQVVFLAERLGSAVAVAAPTAAPSSPAGAVAAPIGAIEALVRAHVAAGLDLSPEAIDRETPFGELGVDSIVAPQIAEEINRAAGISLRSTDLYNFATVRALADHIAEAFPEAHLPDAGRAEAPVAEPVVVSAPAPAPVPLVQSPVAQSPLAPPAPDAIAIIGMAGRFPDAPDVQAFWDNIAAGRSAVREVDRFDLAPFYAPERGKAGKTYARWAATIADFDRFDPLFFAISPAEAEAMDPQQRMLLEEAWHALEDAGATPADLDGRRCGVFVGASANSYAAPAAPSLQTLGGSMAILSARLSYFLNLKGPTFPIDTGCSSSLVALHLACQSLRTGESDMALAGGVSCNLLSPPIFLYLADAGMASPQGRCATFDDAADGFAPGEGVGVVVLKRLGDALRDGDRIHAVIRGTGINQDGKTSGLTAPSATSQTELERAVYTGAGVDPRRIGLVEAHGTGTRLGDPIEVAALTDAFAAFTADRGFCAIGSVKTNIGHAMAAAGIAGLIKAVQAIRHRMLPPTLNFSTANRHIDFAASPFVVNTALRPWESEVPRLAAVSSFGFSGTNAHVVIEEAPPQAVAPTSAGPFLFVLSARSEAALLRRVNDLKQWLRRNPDAPLADVAHTLAVRRAHFRHRRAVVAGSVEALVAALDSGTTDATGALGDFARRYLAGEPPDFAFMTGNLADLPLYPFERERFWNPVEAATTTERLPDEGSGWLTGDHQIQGRKLLPGAAFLERARAAVLGAEPRCAIRDVVWSAPVDATAGDPGVRVDVGDGGACVLRSRGGEHARGVVRPLDAAAPAGVDVASILARCPTALDGAAVYGAARAHGFAYGPGYQVIRDVRVGAGEAIAHLLAPPRPDPGAVLHPALLDGALQTAACISLGGEQDAHVPFALGAFDSHAPLLSSCVVHARLVRSAPGIRVFDIDIATAAGAVIATLRGLQARALVAEAETGTLLYRPEWRPAPLVPGPDQRGDILAYADDAAWQALRSALPSRRVVQVRAGHAFRRESADRFTIDPSSPDDHRRLLAEATPGPATTLAMLWELGSGLPDEPTSLAGLTAAAMPESGLGALFLATQAVLLAPEAGVHHILHASTAPPIHAAAAGLARTVALESSRLTSAALLLDRPDVAAIARELAAPPESASIRHHGDARLREALEPCALDQAMAPLSAGETCVITGGAGAIGLAIARHLARRCQPRLVLLGRSPISPAIEAQLAEIEAAGSDVLYLSADVTSGASLRAALDKARRRFGPLHGVIHAAGVLRDARLVQLDQAGFDAVTGPKVLGAVMLDALTRQDPLRFFAIFSSTAAAFGSAGQGAYAAANGFLNGFAAWRAEQDRPGRSVSLAWPLWQRGGMAPPAEMTAELEREMGMTPMPDDAAMAVLDRALATGPARLVALHGRTHRLRSFVEARSAERQPATELAQPTAPVGIDMRSEVEAYLKTVLSGVTRLVEDRIDPDERFEAYGIDSMMIVRMNTQLEEDLGDLPKTLFFEYQTVRELATCLLESHSDALARRFAARPPAPVEPLPAPTPRPVTSVDTDAIAIIGISGIYPMAADLDQFWRNLADGRDCIVEIPADRWPLEGFYDPDRDRPETSYSKWGGFIDGVDHFDARFFNISPREADALDPQARKFLEVAWATMEDAGLTRETLFRGDVDPTQRLAGVFVGVMYGDYQLFGAEEAVRGNLIAPNAAYWNVANRVSHFLDLHGPSMAVDTACSSSLTAIHMACSALRNGDCTIAFAGGVNLTVHPGKHWILSKSGFASSDGRCRSFGEGGDGYVPGEGVGAVLLKPLARALADGDRIHAVIRSSAVNHGGRTNGYTVPNPVAQRSLVAAALRRGGVSPDSISYVEAHGTGTALGDPVEIAGLTRAFAGVAPNTCPIGSVKSNIGHLESAAGIAALSKVVLQLRHDSLAPSLHAAALNPNLRLEGSPFRVQQTLAPWPRAAGEVRRAGISSFGAGGANAHLVIEDAPEVPAERSGAGQALLVPLSAATPEALREQAERLARFLSDRAQALDFAAVVRTLQTGREAMRHRWATQATSVADLVERLRAFAAGQPLLAPSDLEGWLAGGAFDWDTVSPGPLRPVSLPTYPFARRRCWVTVTPRTSIREVPTPTQVSVPLPCDPNAAVVRDHVFGGRVVLAGAYVLDAVRAMASQAGRQVAGMADVRFLRPVLPDQSAQVDIAPDGRFVVRVGEAAHVTGRLLPDAAPTTEVDLSALLAECPDALASRDIYAALAAGGAEYGPHYQRLETVWRGDRSSLGELSAAPTEDCWPPGLLDAAFQMSFALTTGAGGLAPFAIDRLTVSSDPRSVTHVVAHRRDAGDGFLQLDLRLTDESGAVVIAMDGFLAKAALMPAKPAEQPNLRLLHPVWEPASVVSELAVGSVAILGRLDDLEHRLREAWSGGAAACIGDGDPCPVVDHVWYLQDPSSSDDEASAVSCLAAVVRDLAGRPRCPSLTVVVSAADVVADDDRPAPDPVAAAVAAFAKSVGREHPDMRVRVIDTDGRTEASALASSAADQAHIAWRGGAAWTKHLRETVLPPPMPWRERGVYLIAGGAGGIGIALAEHLVHAARARVVLLGRRPADAQLRARLAAMGEDVLYLTADVTDAEAVANAVGIAHARFGDINGAFHLALVMHDARAVTLTDADIRAVLAPKTDGTRNLMAALADQPLDALMLFSSSNAHTTNPGQAAYAAASAAQDALGLALAPWPVRVIDWGFWGEVGRVATDAYRESLARIGVFPITTAEGMDIIARMIPSRTPQIVPLRISDAVARALGVAEPGLIEIVAQAVSPRAQAGEAMLSRATESFTAIDSYAANLLLLAWQELGVPSDGGSVVALDTIERLGVQPRFRRLVAAQFDMLSRAGFLVGDGGSWRVAPSTMEPAATRRSALAARRAEWMAERADAAPYLALLDVCADRLPAILRGEVEANDVLFPGGDMALVEPIYRGNAVVDHFQAVVADAVAAAVGASGARRVRILEIGAGTGGTTAFVLPALAPYGDRVDYVFTDVGRFFLDAARRRFAEHAFMTTELLDIEQPPASQGFDPNSFDIVIAANVLHATRDIRKTLSHVRALLRRGGLLLVNEATMRQDFNTMTFGLTRGWWAFEDTDRRIAHAPLLEAGSWLTELTRQGFQGARVLVGGAGALQTVLAAQGDGHSPMAERPVVSPPAEPRGNRRIEDILRETVARSLRLTPEEVEPETSFAEYGADSIISVDLVREINAALGIELKTTALFNYATVRALAGYIETEFADRLGVVRDEPAAGTGRARERVERLREIIRKRRQVTEPEAAEVPRDTAPPPDADDGLLQVLRRLQAGEIGVAQAMAEAGDD